MEKSPNEVFNECESLHLKVAELYEASVDGEKDKSLSIIAEVESKLEKFKSEI